MKSVARTAIAVVGLLMLAQGAMAEGPDGGDCESSETCGGGGGGPPSLPNLPQFAISKDAIFSAYPSNGWDSTLVQGTSYYNPSAQDFYLSQFGGGVGTPFTDEVHAYGSGNSYATLQAFFAPTPTVAATAHQDSYHGRSSAGVTLGYLVTLAAPDAATADAIQALMGTNPFATVQGFSSLSASGYGTSYASAYSGYGPDGDENYGISAVCNDSDHASGCGSSSFNFNLGFMRGDQFANGNANYFYALISLSAEADAGLGNLGVWPGDASAFVDPTITLSGLLSNSPYANLLTLDIGGYGPPASANGSVPEPASWALMLGGFGMLGGAMRRRRLTSIALAA